MPQNPHTIETHPSTLIPTEDPLTSVHHLAELLTQAQLQARRLLASDLPEADRTTLRELAWLTFTAFDQKRPAQATGAIEST